MEYQPTERRPIPARQSEYAIRAARTLVRAGVTANQVSIAGMLAALAAGALLWTRAGEDAGGRAAWFAAACLVQLRLLANLLDGMVAVESRTASRTGELYNEIPDRLSDIAILLGLGAAGGAAALGVGAALGAVLTAYVRAQAKASGAPMEYCGPMAKPHRMMVVTLAAVYAALMPAAAQSLPVGDGRLGAATVALWIIAVGCVVTMFRRILRAAAALRVGP